MTKFTACHCIKVTRNCTEFALQTKKVEYNFIIHSNLIVINAL